MSVNMDVLFLSKTAGYTWRVCELGLHHSAGVRPTCLYTTTGFYLALGTERKKHVLEFPKEAIFVNRL